MYEQHFFDSLLVEEPVQIVYHTGDVLTVNPGARLVRDGAYLVVVADNGIAVYTNPILGIAEIIYGLDDPGKAHDIALHHFAESMGMWH
jgi:hypothetical protein